jgi:hypothetical protein
VSKFDLAAALLDEGKPPLDAFAAAKLTYDELKDFLYVMTSTERIGRVDSIVLTNLMTAVKDGVAFEAKEGHFAEARRLEAMHARIVRELVRRG